MITAMSGLGLKGMAPTPCGAPHGDPGTGAFDEAVTTGLQRKRTTMEVLADLLQAEAAHRHAASIRYRMTATKLPVIKDFSAFVFEGAPINEGPGPLALRRQLPGEPAQHRAGRRRRHGQDPPGHSYHRRCGPHRRQGPLLQHRGPSEPA